MSVSITSPYLQALGSNPNTTVGANPNVQAIPIPNTDLTSVRMVVIACKSAIESLGGLRGSTLDRAVTFNDLLRLDLASPQALLSRTGTAAIGGVVGGGGGASFPEAPIDGTMYGRIDTTWQRALALAGGTMTGPLILAGDATAPLGAATLQQLNTSITSGLAGKEDKVNKGVAGGYAPLDGTAKVPAINLPSYVDDVIEVANFAALPAPGAVGVMYVTLDTNKIYRWSGSAYIEISPSPGSTDAVPEGSTNLYFTNARAVAAVQPSLDLKVNRAGDTMTGVLGLTQGSATLPAVTFGAADTGVYGSPTNVVVGTAGVARLTIAGGSVTVQPAQFRIAIGSAAAPALSFSGDLSSGLWRYAVGTIAMAVTGADVMRWVGSTKTTQFFGPALLAANGVAALEAVTVQQLNAAVAAVPAGVSSFNTRTGAVTLALSDITTVGGAPLASPIFSGTPFLPAGTMGVTAAPGDNDTSLATTAFVAAAVAGVTGGAYLPLTGGTLTGKLSIPAGAQYNASLNFGDAQTGLYLGASNTITWAITGGERFTLSASVATFPSAAMGVGIAVPADMPAGSIITNEHLYPAGNVGFNAYVTTAVAWKARTAGYSAVINLDKSIGYLNFFSGSNVAAGAAPTLTAVMQMTPNALILNKPFGVGITPPADAGTYQSFYGDVLSFNPSLSLGWNVYYSTATTNWKQRNAGRAALLQYLDSDGTLRFTSSTSTAAAGAVPNWVQMALIDAGGSLTMLGSVWAANRGGGFGLQAFAADAIGLRFAADGWRLQFETATGRIVYYNNSSTALFSVDSLGNVTANGQLYAVTGVYGTSGVYFSSQNSWEYRAYVQGGTGNHIFAHRDGYYDYWANSGGQTGWVRANVTVMTLDAPGNLTITGAFTATAGVTGSYLHSTGNGHNDGWMQASAFYGGNGVFAGWNGDSTLGMFRSGSYHYMQFSGNWHFRWYTANGDLEWVKNGTPFWAFRSTDNLCFNGLGPVGGYGPYNNYSDGRAKRNIQPSTRGLDDILRLKPVTYERISAPQDEDAKLPNGDPMPRIAPRSEIGFVAQEVHAVLPQAVAVVGFKLPDGTGGLDDPEPSLALTYDTITAVLVRAVQELHDEIALLHHRINYLEGPPS